jgi:hypothetical protein
VVVTIVKQRTSRQLGFSSPVRYFPEECLVGSGVGHLRGSDLNQVVLAESVLGVAGVELEHMLDGVVALDVQGQRLGADEPSNILGARRSGEGARVLVDTVTVQVLSDASEVKAISHGVSAGGGNVTNVSEDRVEERSGVTELGQLEEESNDSNVTS